MRRKITTLTGYAMALVGAGLLFIGTANAQITSAANGDWASTSTWTGGVVPSASDAVEIDHAVTINGNVNREDLTTVNSGASLTVNGDLDVHGTYGDGIYVDGAGTFTINSGATLAIDDVGGITLSGTGSAGGAIQTATRNYNSGITLIFHGDDAQLTGDAVPTLTELEIHNPDGVTASTNITVTDQVTLNAGILDMDSYYLLMKVDATFSVNEDVDHFNVWYNGNNTSLAPDSFAVWVNPSNCNEYGTNPAANNGNFLSSTTFIVGAVRAEFLGQGNTHEYTIPFGFDNGTGAGYLYSPVTHIMRHTGGVATDTNTYEFTVGQRSDYGLGSGLHNSATYVPNHIFAVEEITVPNTLGQQDVTIFWYTYTGLSTPGTGINNVNGLEWNSQQSYWRVITGTSTRSGDICNGALTVYNNNQLREYYALGTGGAPVPVELLDFSGELVNTDVLLKWSTASEINSDYFMVEKSIDGINFEEIGRISAAGNSTEILDYRMIDPNVEAGVIYYRLVQYDFDGVSETFGPIAVSTNGTKGDIITFPNPTEDNISVTLPEMASDAQLVIMDINGKEMYNETVESHRGTLQMNIDVSALPRGIYYVRYGNGPGRFRKQNDPHSLIRIN